MSDSTKSKWEQIRVMNQLKSQESETTKVIQISRNWNQAEEQVIRRNKAKNITFQIKQDERRINSKLNIYKFLMGVPWFFVKSRGVVGVPTNGDMLGEPVISVCFS